MKVVLIRPPYVIPLKSVYGHKGVPPLGIVYLAAALKSNGHDVDCIDSFAEDMDNFAPVDDTEFLANGLSIPNIIRRIPHNAELIGVSVMFSSEWINTSRVIKAIKKAFPETPLVLGGEHVTADYKYILENYPEVDCCILGEGEEKLKNLANSLSEGKKINEIEGIAYYDDLDQKVKSSTVAYRIKNINDIAVPTWDSIPIRNFLDKGMGMSTQGLRTIPMLLSRGCPYRCTFCSSEDMWTTRWIARDIDLVIEEIRSYIIQFQVNHIDFFDLTAVVNRNWTMEFCKRLIKENLGVTWSLPSGTRSEALDIEVLTLLHESGCTKITYAPESGSIRMSKLIKKNVNLEKMLKSMKNAVNLGMVVKANIIFGFPDERIRDALLNFLYMFRMAIVGVHDVPCFGFTPYPGSELFNRLLAEGKIKRDENYYLFLAHLVYSSPLDRVSWSESYPNFLLPILSLGGMAFFYTCQFIMRPWRFYKLVKNVISNKPRTMLEIAFSNMFEDFWKGRRLKRADFVKPISS